MQIKLQMKCTQQKVVEETEIGAGVVYCLLSNLYSPMAKWSLEGAGVSYANLLELLW